MFALLMSMAVMAALLRAILAFTDV